MSASFTGLPLTIGQTLLGKPAFSPHLQPFSPGDCEFVFFCHSYVFFNMAYQQFV